MQREFKIQGSEFMVISWKTRAQKKLKAQSLRLKAERKRRCHTMLKISSILDIARLIGYVHMKDSVYRMDRIKSLEREL